MERINVLVFPAGEINAIELHNALSTCVNINLFGASSIERHGQYIYKQYIRNIPKINDSLFFDKFNMILKENKIDVVFPTHDSIAEFFAQNIHKLCAKIVVADKYTSEICRDKKKTYDFFADCSFVPQLFNGFEQYPVFIKPRKGQGGVNARLVETSEQAPYIDCNEYVFCEYLPGIEYTVDCLTDKDGKLRVISPRSRERTMAGVTISGRTEKICAEIEAIAQTINSRLKFNCLWWFQVKQNTIGVWKLLEISTRCPGTMCLTRAKGINIPLLSVYITMGYDIDVTYNSYDVVVDRTLISRYKISYEYDTVYFDFDDTLTFRSKINLKSIWFLYQCKNNNKNVILLTRHENNIYNSLEKYHIAQSLFTQIVHISKDEKKSDYINPNRAIFIDNAYEERQKVLKVHNIPVFDVDGLEILMDWRM